jgi:Zn-dependent protease with chaperone function
MTNIQSEVKATALPDNFRSEVKRCILSILAFIIVYIVLFGAALLLAFGCMYLGYQIVINFPKVLTLIIGCGLVGLGVMVIIFLLKFLFEKTQEDISDSIEITAKEQPELVAFIHDIAKQTGTHKPKKIFISHDVNACVFYNSSFWSMFLPVRKNLKIGMGLINALNINEFKAVIAHEFGHFSQKSMKLGSFVYNVNRIIFNMLFKNNGYNNTLSGFASVHAIFYFFAHVTAGIVSGIQAVLRQMYKLVNLSYMGLSRQMEFHADLVAAGICGSNNIISSLHRVEVADGCFRTTLNTYDELWKSNKRAEDIYEDHRTVMKFIATYNKWKLVNDIPVPDESISVTGQRVSVKDQWASHPTTEERAEYLATFQLEGPVDNTSAWALIKDPASLKLQITQHIYRELDPAKEKILVDKTAFGDYFDKRTDRNSFPEMFGRFYDNRLIPVFDVDEMLAIKSINKTFAEVFTSEAANLQKIISDLTADIELTKALESGEIKVGTFDFDGTKYKREKAGEVLESLQNELQQREEELKKLDADLFTIFLDLARSANKETQFIGQYREYMQLRKEADAHLVILQKALDSLKVIFDGNTLAYDTIKNTIKKFKEENEPELKRSINTWVTYGAFEFDEEIKKSIKDFVTTDYAYFSGTEYFDNELAELNKVIHGGWREINDLLFLRFKAITEMEASLVKEQKLVGES